MSWQEEEAQRVREMKEGNKLNLDVGTTCFRVLPNAHDLREDGRPNPKLEHSPLLEIMMHYGVGPDQVNLRCGCDPSGAGECWLDKELAKNGNANLADEIRAKLMVIMQVSVFNPEAGTFSKPKTFRPSVGSGDPDDQGESVATRIRSKLAGWPKERFPKDYINPAKGHNLNITKTQKKGSDYRGIRYPELIGDETATRVPLEVLKLVKPLESFVPEYDPEEQKSAFYGRPKEDKDQRSRPRGATPIRAAAPAEPAGDGYGDDNPDATMDQSEADAGYGDDDSADQQPAEATSDVPVDDEYADDAPDAGDVEQEYGNDDPEPPAPPARRAPAPAPQKQAAQPARPPGNRTAPAPAPAVKRPAKAPAPTPRRGR